MNSKLSELAVLVVTSGFPRVYVLGAREASRPSRNVPAVIPRVNLGNR